jgi:hypothetical protein
MGGYLLYNKQEVPHRVIPIEEPLVIFSKKETQDLITRNLKAFLESTNTEQRLQYVSMPTSMSQNAFNM